MVPPLHTSQKPSTEKHVWLCVSSTARGKEWLKNRGTGGHNVTQNRSCNIRAHKRVGSGAIHTPDCHEHSKSHCTLVVKEMADLRENKNIMHEYISFGTSNEQNKQKT